MQKATYTAATFTDAGDNRNEDSSLVKSNKSVFCAVIADGVGGLNKGEIASRYITKSIENWFNSISSYIDQLSFQELQLEMQRTTTRIHEELLDISEEKNTVFGSTMTFCIIGGKRYAVVHVGDSSGYLYDFNTLTKLTTDQTVAEYEKETGETIDSIAENKKAHTLLQCMGQGKIDPSYYEGELPKNFDLLLGSDGLFNTLEISDIEKELKNTETAKCALKNLTNTARSRGEQDNITGVLIRRTYDA